MSRSACPSSVPLPTMAPPSTLPARAAPTRAAWSPPSSSPGGWSKRVAPSDMDQVAALPPLREVIARHGLAADKRFGQHFLLDLNLTAKIAREAGAPRAGRHKR